MRFIITEQPGKDGKQPDSNAPFDEKLFTDHMKFNEEMHKAGVLVAAPTWSASLQESNP